MTQAQANQIRELRLKGVGYRAIGTVVGLSRDIVRNYCRSHGLDGYASALTKNIQEMMEAGEVCNFCGGKMTQPKTGRPKKFCCDKCRREWWKTHPEAVSMSEEAKYTLTCKNCGKTFISYGNCNRKYCSHNCYIKYRFWRLEDENSNTESIVG